MTFTSTCVAAVVVLVQYNMVSPPLMTIRCFTNWRFTSDGNAIKVMASDGIAINVMARDG
jgi:hypothetical protein